MCSVSIRVFECLILFVAPSRESLHLKLTLTQLGSPRERLGNPRVHAEE